MKKLALACMVLLFYVSLTVNAEVIFLDDFQNSDVGSPPVGPQIGTYLQSVGNHTITDIGGGNLALRSTDGTATGGFVIHCAPTVQPVKSIVEYNFQIEQDTTTNLESLNAFGQELILGPTGNTLYLYWGDDGKTYLRPSINGNSLNPIDLGYNWYFDTDYHVVWNVDAVADTYSLTINGAVLCDNSVFGVDLSSLYGFAYFSNYSTIGNQLIDNVKITEVPETCFYVVTGDLNDDCKVNLADFAMMAANWLIDCNANPSDPACVPK